MRGRQGRGGDLTPIGKLLGPKVLRAFKGPTPIQKRLVEAAASSIEAPDSKATLYQHTVLCQTSLPYRDPGNEVREWARRNGNVCFEIAAGKAMHPDERRLVPLGLPFGPKSRLVLMYINQRAIQTQSSHIEVEDSLTAFVRRVLKLDPKGRNIRMVKDQLARLSASSITLGVVRDTPTGTGAKTDYLPIVENFDVWFPKDDRQRVLWPSTIDLGEKYFQSLLSYAVPLNEAHIAALSHSAMALDIYAWLAQRLCRVGIGPGAFISWKALHDQFGQGYNRVDHFRAAFRVALREVLTVYRDACVSDEERQKPRLFFQEGKRTWREPPAKGLILHHSPPPVPRLLHAVNTLPKS